MLYKTMKTVAWQVILITGLLIGPAHRLQCQSYGASPVNWLYPEGNSQATKYVSIASGTQEIDSFRVKWSTPSISGDVQPLIGNIINNKPLFNKATYAPNEIAAIIGGKFVIVDASGKTHRITNAMPFLKGFSVMIDTNQAMLNQNITDPVIMGVETIEFESSDKVGLAYLTGFDEDADTVRILQRLAIDLKGFTNNTFASIKPFFGKKFNDALQIYCTVNMSQPDKNNSLLLKQPFFRGITVFSSTNIIPNYPLPDIGDDYYSRFYFGPEVNVFQPSMCSYTNLGQELNFMMLPSYPTNDLTLRVECDNLAGAPTTGDESLFLEFNTTDGKPANIATDIRMLGDTRVGITGRPVVKPYYVNLYDQATGVESIYILVAEEYKGTDNSTGTPRLHLFSMVGEPLTNISSTWNKPVSGSSDHSWSIAVGNVDGNESNFFGVYYPNNKGLEIIATQSSRDFAVPNSKLMVLKYSSDNIAKPTPPGTYLNNFDTIATEPMNGWVAAVNDLDNGDDEKDEIVLVDGARLFVLKMRDYTSFDFRRGQHFDTLYTVQFDHQTISNVAIADLEGDGKNDMIVTTFDSTYFIGTQILNILEVTDPIDVSDVPVDICPGSGMVLKWRNIIRNSKTVKIVFREEVDGVLSDTAVVIADSVNNWADSLEYTYVPDNLLIGREGYFYVISSDNPKIQDRTSLVRINNPSLRFEDFEKSEYFAGEKVIFKGKAICVDSVIIDYGYMEPDSTINWNFLSRHSFTEADTFEFADAMPCVPELYHCYGLDYDSLIYLRTRNFRYEYKDTSDNIIFKLRPARLPLSFENSDDACPGKLITWDPDNIEFSSETISVSILDPESGTYTLVGEVPTASGSYKWCAPLDPPDCVYLRFCCNGSCVRTDTLIDEFGLSKSRYINFVAPNPFNPLLNTKADIVYKVPTDVKVTINIIDQNNRLIVNIVKNQAREAGLAYCETWDGRRDDLSFVDNGMYYVVIEMSNGEKLALPVFISK